MVFCYTNQVKQKCCNILVQLTENIAGIALAVDPKVHDIIDVYIVLRTAQITIVGLRPSVNFDNALSFTKHVNALCKSVNVKLSALRRLSIFMSFDKRKYYTEFVSRVIKSDIVLLLDPLLRVY